MTTRRQVTSIHNCRWCGCFVCNPSTDRCPSCDGGLYPVAFVAEHGKPFWASGETESRFTPRGKRDD